MDARLFQEAIRSATVTYPIPFIFGVLLLFALKERAIGKLDKREDADD